MRTIADRETSAAAAEERATQALKQVHEANERLLEERRNHASQLVSLQDRLSEAEGARTAAELRLASADAARAAAIAEALAKQSKRYEAAQLDLRGEVSRLADI